MIFSRYSSICWRMATFLSDSTTHYGATFCWFAHRSEEVRESRRWGHPRSGFLPDKFKFSPNKFIKASMKWARFIDPRILMKSEFCTNNPRKFFSCGEVAGHIRPNKVIFVFRGFVSFEKMDRTLLVTRYKPQVSVECNDTMIIYSFFYGMLLQSPEVEGTMALCCKSSKNNNELL